MWQTNIQVAMEQKEADCVFKNAKVICTFTEEVISANVAISNDRIVSLNFNGKAKEEIDLKGAYIAPSFMDAHIHIESSMLHPRTFAEAVVPHGTGLIVTDPHEISNVLGLDGFRFMKNNSQNLPIDMRFSIPSCIPSTTLETSGAIWNASDIEKICKEYPDVISLSEMMNAPGVYFSSNDVLEKIDVAHRYNLPIDGHAPLLTGKQLQAYLNADILNDHECSNIEEALEKMRSGMWLLIREGTAAKNLSSLVSLIQNNTIHRICVCTDDKHADEISQEGHLDYIFSLLCKYGINPIRAIRLLTLNTATMYKIPHLGAIAPNYWANFIIFDSLENFKVQSVYYHGQKVAQDGTYLYNDTTQVIPPANSIVLPPNYKQALQQFPTQGKVNCIKAIQGELLTNHIVVDAEDVLQKDKDVAYIAVIERYGKTNNIGLGFAQGFGLFNGALGTTVAHDSHNLLIIGKDIKDMTLIAEHLAKVGGGFCVAEHQQILATVPLTIAGLMSTENASTVKEQMENLQNALKKIGCKNSAPFMTASFLALPVIPALKITDYGLISLDSTGFHKIPTAVTSEILNK